jgi:hypothetical protein
MTSLTRGTGNRSRLAFLSLQRFWRSGLAAGGVKL